jgi:hypothetical protein
MTGNRNDWRMTRQVVEQRIMQRNGLEVRTKLRHYEWRRHEWWLASALGALLLAGCGAEAYDKRLGNTKLLFAHMEVLNQHLQGTWSDSETGISLRAPLQFVLLPPPVRAAADPAAEKNKPARNAGAQEEAAEGEAAAMEEGEAGEEEVPDSRQPEYINIGLPGLRGAFKATVKLIAGNNANANSEGEAFLYVLSNHDLAEKPEEAKDFEKEFIKILTETLHVSVDADTGWRDEKFPPGDPSTNGFVTPLKYRNVTVTSPEEIAGYTRQFSAYMYEQSDIQVIVLFVLPADTDTSENMTKRIPLVLETLAVSGNKLALPAKGFGAPAGGGPQTF